MARPEYPTSIRLTSADKRRLRKQAEKSKRSLAGLIQMILIDWLREQEKPNETPKGEVGIQAAEVQPDFGRASDGESAA